MSRISTKANKPADSRACVRNFLLSGCTLCDKFSGCRKYLSGYAGIPLIVIDHFLPILTANEWKILTYVARRASFEPGRDFGKIFPRYDEITRATGVKQPGRCLKRLKKLHLIEFKQNIVGEVDKNVSTLNTITVAWFKALRNVTTAAPANTKTPAKIALSFTEYATSAKIDNETDRAIRYYLKVFKEHRGEEHPRLRAEQWKEIAASFRLTERGAENPDFMIDMIDEYFADPPSRTRDFKILHFNSPGVKVAICRKLCDLG